MTGKKSKNFEVTIEKLVYGGSGFGRHKGKVVFVPFSVPGDRLIVRPVEEKKTFIRAEIVQVLNPAEGRVAPSCPYFEKCGGCQWQQLEYARQVEAKRQILEEAFHHRFPETRELPISMLACDQPFGYRSRARVQMRGAGPNASVGFFRCGSHAVVDVESCPLFRPSLNEALASVRQYKIKVDMDATPQEMDMACSEEEDVWATARPGSGPDEAGTPLLGAGTREGVLLKRRVGEFTYGVTASVFFQANDFMIDELVALVQACAEGAGSGTALDLFSGVGLLSLPLARQFARVIAVENSPAAVKLCTRNAGSAGLGNVRPVCADVSTWLTSPDSSSHAPFDLIVLDPPRTGAGLDLMDRIRDWAPATIIYVSCDPQTLVRDLAGISPSKYKISRVAGLDLFPQTFHFETVVRLQKR